MVPLTRRTVLKAAGVGLALPIAGAAAEAQATVETVVAIPEPDKVPENLAIDENGVLYFGIATDPGEVYAVLPEQTQETDLTLADLERVVRFPSGTRVIGVEVVPDGTLYVAVSSSGEDNGVWRIPRDGREPSLYAAITGFANDVLYDPTGDRLLVSESMGGAVYEVPLDAEDPATAASVWVGTAEDNNDAPLDTASFGANGLTFGDDGTVYVAVTRVHETEGDPNTQPVRGRLIRVPVEDDGSAGEPEVFVESEAILGADGLTARGADLYVAANALNQVVEVTPEGEPSTIASADDGLVFPSDVVFGTTAEQQDTLFICNFANEDPANGAILRTTVPATDGDGTPATPTPTPT